MKSKPLDINSLEKIRLNYRQAQRRLILIDFDGTLVPLADSPDIVFLNEEAESLLDRLTYDSKNKIIIVSGREREFLETQFQSLVVTLIAEHGYFIKEPGTNWIINNIIDLTWQNSILPVLKEYTGLYPGSLIEKKYASLAWHYRNVNVEFTTERLIELKKNLSEVISKSPSLKILDGNKVLEIKSELYDKGTAVSAFIQKGKFDFIMAIGDDVTDEDLFRVIPEYGITVKIGPAVTSALYYIKDQTKIYNVLNNLISD